MTNDPPGLSYMTGGHFVDEILSHDQYGAWEITESARLPDSTMPLVVHCLSTTRNTRVLKIVYDFWTIAFCLEMNKILFKARNTYCSKEI